MPAPIINDKVWLKLTCADPSGNQVGPWTLGAPYRINFVPLDAFSYIPVVINNWVDAQVPAGITDELVWYQTLSDHINIQLNNYLTEIGQWYPQAYSTSVIQNGQGIFLQIESKLPIAQYLGLIITSNNLAAQAVQVFNPNLTQAPQNNTSFGYIPPANHGNTLGMKFDANHYVTLADLTTMAATGKSLDICLYPNTPIQQATFNVKINGVTTAVPCNGDGTGAEGDGGNGWATNLLTKYFQTILGISVQGNFYNNATLTNTTANLMTIEVWLDDPNGDWIAKMDGYAGQAFANAADNKPNTTGFWVCLAATP